MIPPKKILLQLLVCTLGLLFFLSCQKDLNNENVPQDQLPDLATKVTSSSVSGFVTDENNAAVISASVAVGNTTVLTDKYGFFEVKNILVIKNAAVVMVYKPGYFKGIKTFIAEDNKAKFFRIKLIPKIMSGNIDAAGGGNVSLSSGLSIALPANAVVSAASGAAYMGMINVSAHYIDPTAADLNQIMPGDLRGIKTDGSIKLLTTYGMAAVELTGASGELLQIASGKKATITMPIPSSISGSAPATIPLWYFDEVNGLWKEEGQAIKTGNTYVAEVSHFSFWNCDTPNNYIPFNCTIQDAAGNPLPYMYTTISEVSNLQNTTGGYTDVNGYVAGPVPNTAQLVLKIFNNDNCSTPVYSQVFNTSNTSFSLGVVTVTATLDVATISGNVTDCSNNPVNNGYIIMKEGYQYYRYALSNTGSYNFSAALCNNISSAVFIAEDLTAMQQSPPLLYTLVSGANTIGTLQACGVNIQEFINYSINGGSPISYSVPTGYVSHTGNGTTMLSYVAGGNTSNSYVNFSFDNTGIAPGSIQDLTYFRSSAIIMDTSTNLLTPIGVNITEYGSVGEYISGNFNGTVTAPLPPNNNYLINCNFRVKRNF